MLPAHSAVSPSSVPYPKNQPQWAATVKQKASTPSWSYIFIPFSLVFKGQHIQTALNTMSKYNFLMKAAAMQHVRLCPLTSGPS